MWVDKAMVRKSYAVGFEGWSDLLLAIGVVLAVLFGGWLSGCAYGGGVCLPGAACVPGQYGANTVPTTTGCTVEGSVDLYGGYLNETSGCGAELWVSWGGNMEGRYLPTGGDLIVVAKPESEFRQYVSVWDGMPNTHGSHIVGEGMIILPSAVEVYGKR
ncbi:MAG: hypothetical protein HW383_756 [Candidatus Magasanikbacteria bacterium]|nr:hypothetical protein [Candidatus Magasanikbacteria bacterium]